MRYWPCFFLWLGAAFHQASADYAALQSFFAQNPNYLPAESAEMQPVPNSSIDAVVFREADSVRFLLGNTVCLTTGSPPYPCFFSVSSSLTQPVDSIFANLPMQKMARVFLGAATANPRPLYFIVVQRRNLLLYTYIPPSTYAIPILQRVDTIQLPTPMYGFVLGIDTIFQMGNSYPALFNIRLYGKWGMWGNSFISSPYHAVSPVFNMNGPLHISAVGEGFFGTLDGQIVDPARGLANPIKVADQPILAINRFGAVGDSGLAVLHDGGNWRTFRLGTNSFRTFSSFYGPRGTYGHLCDNRFQCADYWLKNDSTVWTYDPATWINANTPAPIGSDSTNYLNPGGDTLDFVLYDTERNFNKPAMTLLPQIGPARSLDSTLFGNFVLGCEGGRGTCFPTDAYANAIMIFTIRADPDSITLHTLLKRSGVVIDTQNTATWSPGDTLSMKFSNATYTLINSAPVAIPSSGKTKAAFQIRVINGEVQWHSGQAVSVNWVLKDLRGRPVLQGRENSAAGSVRPAHLANGVYGLIFKEASSQRIMWQGRIVLP